MLRADIPKNAYTKTGQAVSGYRNLPEKVLEEEGWDLKTAAKEIVADKPIGKVEQVDTVEELKQRVNQLEAKVFTEKQVI